MAITIGQPGPAADATGAGPAPSAAAALVQAQGALSSDAAALFGSLGLGTNADAFA